MWECETAVRGGDTFDLDKTPAGARGERERSDTFLCVRLWLKEEKESPPAKKSALSLTRLETVEPYLRKGISAGGSRR